MDKLAMLKRDLQLLSNANDELLVDLLQAADKFIKREGIKDDGGIEYTEIQVQYAAYLFRRRAGGDTGMPRFLRYEMNNLLFAQKASS
ncbi:MULTISPECIES: hypothetical protein [Bacillota]|jgi:hypothetical protein|uniref:hypothetical protein n=1 Tax=Bacillota TaxID=1239 RepID=UPI000E421027|nr:MULTISPECIES: hypothetical protein [Bacillota]RGB58590.1 hypothetical protein DW271_02575 [Absiella sp. AM22-9]DAY77823.1 MAG TPA: Head Tail Connector Protein [Caudoviricetes sp.]